MAVITGDLLQIVDEQEYLGEQVLNVYYYRWFSAPSVDNGVYPTLLTWFFDNVVSVVSDLQNQGLEHVRLEVKNLSNGIDFAEDTISEFGSYPGAEADYLPSFNCLSFKLVRDSLVTRNGAKRICGLVDGMVNGNDYVGNMDFVNAYRAAILEQPNIGLISVAAPVIVKRPIEPPVGLAYPYSSVVDVSFQGLGTQNTRKKGRGA